MCGSIVIISSALDLCVAALMDLVLTGDVVQLHDYMYIS